MVVGHVNDPASVREVIEALRGIHGQRYGFALKRWWGEATLRAPPGRMSYVFFLEAEEAGVALRAGDRVRGPDPCGPYRVLADGAEAVEAHVAQLWPGDVVCLDGEDGSGATLKGRGTWLQVVAEATSYRAPRLAMLRHLENRPGGCAAYAEAFRREVLPPQTTEGEAGDRRGANRVNEHTLDMRPDRLPLPAPHYHGRVPCGRGLFANHSETAVMLPRSVYGLAGVEGTETGEVMIYPRPGECPEESFAVTVEPGSIVVTPATAGGLVGHRFSNAFAMLVAIPGFVAPYVRMDSREEE